MRICLDVGHGTGNRTPGVYDPGAVAGGYREHIIARGMVARLKADLVALGHSVLVTTGALSGRDDKAAKWGAQLFVSIHCNAGGGKGVEVWVDPLGTPLAKRIASLVCRNLAERLKLPNRGVKSKWLAVLRGVTTDLLVELFFIDSPTDRTAYQRAVEGAELAILNGILMGIGHATVSTPPRLKSNPTAKPGITRPERQFVRLQAHIDAADLGAYLDVARTCGDALFADATTEDSYKSWTGTRVH